MPDNPPLTAAGSRDPHKQRKQPIPRKVREACDLMVYGRADDEDAQPLDFIEAAKDCGIAPDIMRRWLDRGPVRAYLLASRRTFRAAICAGNEGALQRVRDKSKNGMVTVAAVRALEQMDEEASTRSANPQTPGITIRVVTINNGPPAAPVIDVTPHRPMPLASPLPQSREPIFMGGPKPDDLQVDDE
jgi:hypothetical protein